MKQMVLLGDEAQLVAHFGPLEVVLIVTQGSCKVCTEHTTAMKIILDAPD